MKQTVLFLLVLSIVLLPSCKFLRQKGLIGRKHAAAVILKAKQDSIRVADSLKNVKARLDALETARQDSIRQAEQARADYEAKFKFNIIVGSFITPDYARKFRENFEKKGFNAKIMKLEGTQFEMVSAESHQSLRDAANRLAVFRDSLSTEAWIYVGGRR